MNNAILAALATASDYMAARRVYPSASADAWMTARLKTVEYYENGMIALMQQLYNDEMTTDEFEIAMLLLIAAQLRRAWNEGLREAGFDPADETQEMENELLAAIAEEQAHVERLAQEIRAAALAGILLLTFLWRVELWSNRYNDLYNRGVLAGGKKTGGMFVWHLGATEKHCHDCFSYAGLRKTAQQWHQIYQLTGHRPQSYSLQCRGMRCDCKMGKA